MSKKLFILLFFLVVSPTLFAENCPTVEEIKTGLRQGWKFYDNSNDTPLPPQLISQFKAHAKKFLFVEWNKKASKGAVHCYYGDQHGSFLEAYLTKDNLIPENTDRYWYNVTGAEHCAAGAKKCRFRS